MTPRTYVAAVVAAGALGLVALAVHPGAPPGAFDAFACLTLALGVLFGEAFPVRIGGDAGEVAFSSTFTFALLLGWGPGPAAAAQVGACLIAALGHRTPPRRVAFNMAQYVLAVLAATGVLILLRGQAVVTSFDAVALLQVSAAAAAFFAVNTGLVAGVIALSDGRRLLDQIRDELLIQTGTEGILLGMAPLALLGVRSSPALMILIALPLLAVQRAGRQAVENEQLARRDALTGLANRTQLTDRAEVAMARARREHTSFAVLLVDLDRFKEINDTLGHHVGDRVLCECADRISSAMRDGDLVARLGGDEFAVLLCGVETQAEALDAARRVAGALSRPLEMAGVVLEPGGSVGVACYPSHGEDVDTLLRHADAAMYTAKGDRIPVAIHTPEDDGAKLTQLKLAGRLSSAIADGEIELLFQPQVRPSSGEVVGVEALARWQHPHFGLLPPSAFVPLAERSGHIMALTVRIIDDATLQLAAWQHAGLDLTMAVNLSAATLLDPDLPAVVESACERAGVRPDRLVLEITEGMLVARPDEAIAIAERLAALGVGISVDDFGTGFSSLEQLVNLPAVELKIDRSFVMRMAADTRSAAIVRCVADLGRSLDLRIVAEGVETEAVRGAVEGLGCDLAQGFLWARPLSAGDLTAFALSPRGVGLAA